MLLGAAIVAAIIVIATTVITIFEMNDRVKRIEKHLGIKEDK